VELNVEMKKTVFYIVTDAYDEENLTDSISIQGVGSDSLIVDNELVRNIIGLPLKNFSDSTAFVFHLQNQIADTVNFIYENEQSFLSFECGCLVFHTLKDVKFSRHNIDSVIIKNDYVALGNKDANVKIYFHNR
jgi:hypothetical protein